MFWDQGSPVWCSRARVSAVTRRVALSLVIGNIIELRRRSYDAYRAGLGPDGTVLPGDFATVVQAVLAFAERLTDAATPTTTWNGSTRLWID
jgi:hypothetical protein